MVALTLGINIAVAAHRYFLRRLRRVKKANGQILSVNEVGFLAVCIVLLGSKCASSCWLRWWQWQQWQQVQQQSGEEAGGALSAFSSASRSSRSSTSKEVTAGLQVAFLATSSWTACSNGVAQQSLICSCKNNLLAGSALKREQQIAPSTRKSLSRF